MLSRFIARAVTATILTVSLAHAQSFSQLGGPVNYPPVGFGGQQFVDNDGCMFLLAGFGGAVKWVPRVNADRRPLCGLPPTFRTDVAAAVKADMASVPLAAAPVALAAARRVSLAQVARPVVAAAPPALVAHARSRNSLLAQLFGMPATASAQGASGGVLTARMMQGAVLAYPSLGAVRASSVIPLPPKGYRLAWKDDRLNPLRGLGTANGQAQQDQVWSRDIPARLVSAAPLVAPPRTTAATMSAPAALTGAAYVEVGTFGEPANAEAVKQRLSALGLPVSTSKITRKGRVLQVVYAGPFAIRAEAEVALATTRNAGFPDAILK